MNKQLIKYVFKTYVQDNVAMLMENAHILAKDKLYEKQVQLLYHYLKTDNCDKLKQHLENWKLSSSYERFEKEFSLSSTHYFAGKEISPQPVFLYAQSVKAVQILLQYDFSRFIEGYGNLAIMAFNEKKYDLSLYFISCGFFSNDIIDNTVGIWQTKTKENTQEYILQVSDYLLDLFDFMRKHKNQTKSYADSLNNLFKLSGANEDFLEYIGKKAKNLNVVEKHYLCILFFHKNKTELKKQNFIKLLSPNELQLKKHINYIEVEKVSAQTEQDNGILDICKKVMIEYEKQKLQQTIVRKKRNSPAKSVIKI